MRFFTSHVILLASWVCHSCCEAQSNVGVDSKVSNHTSRSELDFVEKETFTFGSFIGMSKGDETDPTSSRPVLQNNAIPERQTRDLPFGSDSGSYIPRSRSTLANNDIESKGDTEASFGNTSLISSPKFSAPTGYIPILKTAASPGSAHLSTTSVANSNSLTGISSDHYPNTFKNHDAKVVRSQPEVISDDKTAYGIDLFEPSDSTNIGLLESEMIWHNGKSSRPIPFTASSRQLQEAPREIVNGGDYIADAQYSKWRIEGTEEDLVGNTWDIYELEFYADFACTDPYNTDSNQNDNERFTVSNPNKKTANFVVDGKESTFWRGTTQNKNKNSIHIGFFFMPLELRPKCLKLVQGQTSSKTNYMKEFKVQYKGAKTTGKWLTMYSVRNISSLANVLYPLEASNAIKSPSPSAMPSTTPTDCLKWYKISGNSNVAATDSRDELYGSSVAMSNNGQTIAKCTLQSDQKALTAGY